MRSPSSGTLYTLDSLTLTCETTIPSNPAVDVPLQVSHQWRRDWAVLSNNSEIIISDVRLSSHHYSGGIFRATSYTTTLTYSSLLSPHSGTHTCTSTVQPQGKMTYSVQEAIIDIIIRKERIIAS